MSESLIHSFLVSNFRSLTKNERKSELLLSCEQIPHSLIFGQKTSNLLGKPISQPCIRHTKTVWWSCEVERSFTVEYEETR